MSSLLKSTGTVAASTFSSRILGFVREMLFSRFFGASGATDAFIVAFRIPNLLRRFVAEGAFSASFIPIYTEYIIHKGEDETLKLAQKTLSVLMIFVTLFIIFGELFSQQVVGVFAWGFTDDTTISLAVDLNKIMFPYLYFVSFVGFSMGVLNTRKYFFAPAFAPVLLNVGIITGIVFFSRFFETPLYGVAFGVLFGGMLQVLLQLPYLIKSGYKFTISIDFKHPGIRRIFRLMGPLIFANSIYPINMLVNTGLASMLPEGSISYLYFSERITELVLGVFIVSIGTVILPEMSKMTANNDFKSVKDLYAKSIRAALFLSIPALFGLIVAGIPVISVIYMGAEFDFSDVILTYRALMFASMGIASIAILRITTPTFYSLKDTKTPVIASTISFALNISLGYILMQTKLEHAGLALANAISSTAQMLFLVIMLQRKIGRIKGQGIALTVTKITTASLIMGAAVYFIVQEIAWAEVSIWIRFFWLLIVVGSGMAIYSIVCMILKVDEFQFMIRKVTRRLIKRR
jgi:putative peptidoglycan lipid II flippase